MTTALLDHPARRRHHIPPRHFLVALLCVGALAACSSDTNPAPDPDSAAFPGFSYTGARGETVELDAVPRRIVVQESAASALIPFGIRPVGIWGASAPEESVALQGLDMSGIESLGQTFGEINVEKVAALDPDLIIAGYYPLEKQIGGLNPGDTTTVERLKQIAPIVTVNATNAASRFIEDFAALARKLGADENAPDVVEARRAFQDAVEDFKAAVAAKPGLTVTAVSASDQLYIANPPDFAEFIDLKEWGLDMQVPAGVDDRGYFKTISWENAASEATGDLLFFDTRPGNPTVEDIAAQHPTWSSIPAAKADAIAPWVTDSFTNYANYTKHLTTFTEAIEKADPNLVP